MSLTDSQNKQIQAALLAAFDEVGLRQLVRQALNTDLNAVAGGKNNAEIILNLIAWVERENRVSDLVNGALHQNSLWINDSTVPRSNDGKRDIFANFVRTEARFPSLTRKLSQCRTAKVPVLLTARVARGV